MHIIRAVVAAALVSMAGTALAAGQLANDKQKFSYVMGLQIGQQIKAEGIDLDKDAFAAAINDAMTGAKPRLTMDEMKAVVENYQRKRAETIQAAAEKNRKDGEAFLAANRTKAGVKVLPSGLQYKEIQPGKGKSPKATDTVVVNYRGTLIDGKEFDSSYKRGQPAEFPVNGVIPGWTEALQKMKEGAKWQIYVPSKLAYGQQGAPGGLIGPNATLIFDVELIKVK